MKMKKHSRGKAIVSLDAIAHNFSEIQKKIGKDTKVIAVIKADGYGHGALEIARFMHEKEFIWGFAVATAEEAFQLREDGVSKPILILGVVFEESFEELIRQDISLALCSKETAQKLNEEAKRQNKYVQIHIALDTGMTRIGFADIGESVSEVVEISKLSHVKIEGLFTHFARADETDSAPAYIQLERYQKFAQKLTDAGVTIPYFHCSNSAGIMRVPEGHFSLVRAGIIIYGIYPSDEVEKETMDLMPALEWKSTVSFVKDVHPGAEISYGGTFVAEKIMRVATVPLGYADGYPRLLSNKGSVLIRGKRARILGRICMDQFMVDVTEIAGVEAGDEVTLVGQDGEKYIGVEELGEISGRFPYEFVCGISKRVPRVYIKNGKECTE